MSSGDFNLLHLRNLKMYNPDGAFAPVSSIFTISTNGVPLYTNDIALRNATASTVTASTVNVSGSLGFSTLVGSTLQAGSGSITSLSASTFSASTISSNLLTTPDIALQSSVIALGLSTTSTQTNFSQGSYAAGSWLTAKSGLVNPRKLGTSASGQYQIVVSGATSDLWLSSDSGITWSLLAPASTGLPVLTGSAYWSSGNISASGQYILLGVYGGSLWMSQDYGRTFALTAQTTPDIWLQLNGNVNDAMGGAAATATGSPGYVTVQQPGYSGQAINLANTAGSTATRYVRGAWTGAQNFTISFWMNPQTVSGAFQILVSAYSGTLAFCLTSTAFMQLYIPNTSSAIDSSALSSNTWHYITGIFQANGTCSLYINNNLIGSRTNVGGFGTTSIFELSGSDNINAFAFNGYIADFRLYNSALTYNPIPLLAPNIWLPFENTTMDCGSQSANSAGSTIYLPFEGAVTDSMGVSTVTATGSPGYVAANRAGYTGQAVSLANTAGGTATQYLRGSWTPPNPVNFAVSFWFNPQTVNGTQQNIFGVYNGAFLVYINTSNQLVFQLPTGSGLGLTSITSSAVSAGTWYFVTTIFQTGGTCSFYVNNTLAGTYSNSGGVGGFGFSGNYGLGCQDNATVLAFNGYVDDFRIYNYAITYNPVSIVTVTGSLSYVPGVVGLNAVNLVNTAGGTATQYIEGTWAGASNFSVSCWVNPQTVNGTEQRLFGAYNGFVLFLISTSNQLAFRAPTGSGTGNNTIVTSFTVSTSTWYYLTGIFQSNGTVSFYVNNSLIGTFANSGGFGTITSTNLFRLGCQDNATVLAFNGYIDDFRLYNAAIPYHALNPQNYRAVALSGNAQYALASAASGWVQGSADLTKTWAKQSVCVGTQGDLIQPNLSGLGQAQWSQNGVNWVASASSIYHPTNNPAYGAFNNNYSNSIPYSWASVATYTSGTYSGSVSTTVTGIGAITGEWLQIQSSLPTVLQSYAMASGGSVTLLPKGFYIIGSNDGSTWYPLQQCQLSVNPFTTTFTGPSNNIILNLTGTQTVQGNQTGTGTTTSYATSTTPYLYFRIIVNSIWPSGTVAEIGELYLNFARPSPTALSLSYSGQYQLVATGSAAGSIMPNQTGLASATWSQGGVTWGAAASSSTDANSISPFAFNNNTGTASQTCWKSDLSKYNTTTGAYSASVSTTILGIGAISGEWLQIQSSVPVVLQSYTFGCATFTRVPRLYYVAGSMDGSNWYPVQSCNITTTPFTADSQLCSNYVIVNSTGVQALTAGQAGSITTTSYSTTTQPWMYFRLITTNIQASNDGLVSIAEWYLNFANSYSYSSNYGSSWLNGSRSLSNEIVSLSPSGQYALSTNCVPPLARLTMDNTAVDAQGVLTQTTGAGTVTYSSSIVRVGTHSAFFNQTAGDVPTNYLNYTVPAILNKPSALTISCWFYTTALPSSGRISIPIAFSNGTIGGVSFYFWGPDNGSVARFAYAASISGYSELNYNTAISTNTWYHFVGTASGGVTNFYVNGALISSGSYAGTICLSGNLDMTRFVVGAQYLSGPYPGAFAGYVDDVRIYTQALSADEVNALYKNPALTQSIGVSSSYLPITAYSEPTLPGATANVVDAKVSQTGQYMVAVTAGATNNVYYSVDSGSSFNAITLGSSSLSTVTPLARLTLDNTNVDAQAALTPATGAGTVTYSSAIMRVGSHSAFFNQTAGAAPSVYLNYSVPAVLNTPSALTMACWVYPTSIVANVTPISLNNGSGYGNHFYINSTANFWYNTTNSFSGTGINSNTSVPLNTWTHLTMTYTGAVITLYVNGISTVSANVTGQMCLMGGGSITKLFVGAGITTENSFAGYVDDVRLYTSALSAAEVNNLYAAPPMAACSISNDGSYLTATNTTGTVYTLNRNSNTFTLALGNQAGQINQASNAIAIGNLAGQLNQSANSIVLNASGSALNATAPGFYVAPIADTAGLPMNLLGYGADSQVVKTGVTVLPGYANLGGAPGYACGNVGIGTTNPTYKLQIEQGLSNNSNGLFISNSNYGSMQGLNISMVNAGLGNFNSYAALQGYTSGVSATTNIVLQPSSGNVGIGTTNPLANLHTYSTSTYQTPGLVIENSTVTNAQYQLVLSGSAGWGTGGSFGIYNTKAGSFSMVISPTGNVGIGTTAPTAKLHVNGTTLINSGVFSATTDFTYSSGTPTWTPGNEGSWSWGGKGFIISFAGSPDNSGVAIRAAFIVFHSRGSALNDSYTVITPLYNAYVSAYSGTNTTMSFTFNSPNSQVVRIDILTINH